MKAKKVLVFGTFDGLHPGHVDLFRQAAELGQVVAIVARDSNVLKLKSRAAASSERSRLARVAARPEIARARLGDPADLLRPIIEESPDILALGYDQQTFGISELKKLLAARGLRPQIIRLRAFHPTKYKSSLLRK